MGKWSLVEVIAPRPPKEDGTCYTLWGKHISALQESGSILKQYVLPVSRSSPPYHGRHHCRHRHLRSSSGLEAGF